MYPKGLEKYFIAEVLYYYIQSTCLHIAMYMICTVKCELIAMVKFLRNSRLHGNHEHLPVQNEDFVTLFIALKRSNSSVAKQNLMKLYGF